MPDSHERLSMDEHRAKAIKELEKTVVRIQDELDRMIKLHVFMREALENEIMSGAGYKKLGANEKDVKKLKELTQSMDSLVSCKIRWDKAAKQMAETMTPDEEMKAVITYILSLSPEDQSRLRDRLHDKGIYKWKS